MGEASDCHQIEKIIKRIRAIPERIGRFGVDHIEGVTFTNYDPNTRVKIYGESSLFFKEDDLVGIKYEKEKLVEWLLCKQPQRSVISVVGMGGGEDYPRCKHLQKSKFKETF